MRSETIEERIRDAMTGEQTVPRSELWEEIAARRASGKRVTMPVAKKHRVTRVLAISGAAAAVLMFIVPLLEPPALEHPARLVRPTPPKASEGLFMTGALMAQASATPVFAISGTADGTRRPGKWTHGRFESGELKETYSFELRHSTYQSTPAWLMISTMTRVGRSWNLNDTTWASVDSMQPFLRVVNTGESRIEQTFRKDDILTGVTRNGYTSWSTILQRDPSLPFGGGILFRPSEISMRLMAMDLKEGWQGSIPLPAVGEQGLASLWLNLVVDGAETLNVPAGKFETWRLRLRPRSGKMKPYDSAHPPLGLYFWVSKQERWLIQMSIVAGSNEPDETPMVLLKGEEE